MGSREWKQVSHHERKIAERYMKEIPVKLGALAKELGVKVRLSSLGIGQSGLIHKVNGGYEIKINRNESRERQRFTLAHELGHYFLHRQIIDNSPDGIHDNVLYRSKSTNYMLEIEANKIAADLIMPIDRVIEKIKMNSNCISEELLEILAEQFQVSKAAMEIRVNGVEVQEIID